MKCHVVGCNRPIARKNFMWALLRGIGFNTRGASEFADAFGNGACEYHCTEEVKRAAYRAGLEVRETKEKIKVIGKRQPERSYPAGYQDRLRRLREIESDMARPSRSDQRRSQINASIRESERLRAAAQSEEDKRLALVQRRRLFYWLRLKGYDPSKIYNV